MIKEFPSLGAGDPLTTHLDVAINNIAATITRNATEYPLLPEVDNCYKLMVDALINPPGFLEGFFLMRSHAAFRAGCMLAMGGHNPETFPLLRSCLENALYALHIHKNDGLDELWLSRHDNDSTEKKVREEFHHGNVIKTLKSVDNENHKVAVALYQRTIDFGAHPNERAMSASMGVKKDGGKSYYMQDYLSGGTMNHRHSLKSCAQVGLCALFVFGGIYRERFAILGITERLKSLKDVL